MGLLNKYRKERLLEKRLSRLENLILERSMLEAVKPNIFSKNINAVKAAEKVLDKLFGLGYNEPIKNDDGN